MIFKLTAESTGPYFANHNNIIIYLRSNENKINVNLFPRGRSNASVKMFIYITTSRQDVSEVDRRDNAVAMPADV